MEWMSVNDLREQFLSFFESKQHTRLPSFPLVPQGDNSLLLINSGMAPMKKFFLGLETPPNKRVTTCQKCIRTPDIERVGKTSRHGTYFEMLGNFSFGDYFKHEAIAWAWEFFTEVMKIPREKLYISVYLEDNEAYDIWTKEIGVDPSHMTRLGKEDNFWEHGSGPCGPCSEIYFDRGPEKGCGRPECAVGCDCDRYVEIWNIVFSQFDSDGAGTYSPMEHPNIDTGMGLERLACVMQGVDNLFEVDTVRNIMKHISEIAGVEYGADPKSDVSLRVITDHIRSTTFMVGDGILPENEGRGYVLRRLLRRAARHGKLLGIDGPFLHKVAATVMKENEPAYPELLKHADYIEKVILAEEERFTRTLDQGMDLLFHMIDHVESQMVKGVLPGDFVFKLYDTFGFPLDLTREITVERGLQIDEEQFERLMQEQRERARKARESTAGSSWSSDAFSDLCFGQTFTGYTDTQNETRIMALSAAGERTERIHEGEEGVLVLEKTPFYAESGGQVGDTGTVSFGENVFEVIDCRKSATGYFLHIGRMKSGSLATEDTVTAHIDEERRAAIRKNHSACHLLQYALRRVLGDHVHQAGSMVNDTRCRFDFSHFEAMTKEQIEEVEKIVNGMIFASLPVDVTEMSLEEAKKTGAMALFGEKYSDIVRVCSMGGKSVELCGGTHVNNTAVIGLFKIISESSVAAGVRRIEATTGHGVYELLCEREAILGECGALLKTSPAELPQKVRALMNEMKDRAARITELEGKIAASEIKDLFSGAREVKGTSLIVAGFEGVAPDALRKLIDKAREAREDCVAILYAVTGEKASIAVGATKKAVEKGVHAGKLVKALTSLTGGSGGGRPDSAMGGATEIFKIDEAMAQVPAMLEEMIRS